MRVFSAMRAACGFGRGPRLQRAKQRGGLRVRRREVNKRDVPYQSLLKIFLAERLKAEFESDDAQGKRR